MDVDKLNIQLFLRKLFEKKFFCEGSNFFHEGKETMGIS